MGLMDMANWLLKYGLRGITIFIFLLMMSACSFMGDVAGGEVILLPSSTENIVPQATLLSSITVALSNTPPASVTTTPTVTVTPALSRSKRHENRALIIIDILHGMNLRG
jgi:hypothetical protein